MDPKKIISRATIIGVVVLSGANIFAPAYAIKCPPPPKQVDQDLIIDARGKLSSLLKFGSGELEGRVEKRTHDLFSKYPNADEIVLKNLMINIFCQMLDESGQTDSEKFDLFFNFNRKVMQFVPPDPRKVMAFYNQLVEIENAAKDTRTMGDPLVASLSSIISGLKNELSQDSYIQAVSLPENELSLRQGLGDASKRDYAKTRASQLSIYIRHNYPETIGIKD